MWAWKGRGREGVDGVDVGGEVAFLCEAFAAMWAGEGGGRGGVDCVDVLF